MGKSLYAQLRGIDMAAIYRKETALDKMRPALDAIDMLTPLLNSAGVSIDVNKYLPYLENNETVIQPATGSARVFSKVLLDNGFKRVTSKPCYSTYTKGAALIRVYS